MTAVVPIED